MILLIDNYDSFTFNLVQYLGELGETCLVYRNDQINLSTICKIKPKYLVVSPGPCTPQEAGISERAILQMAGQIPVLGVCLGHQCIGCGFRRENHPGQAVDAREEFSDLSRRQDPLPRPPQPISGHPVPFPSHRAGKPAGVPGDFSGDRGRGNYGRPTQNFSR